MREAPHPPGERADDRARVLPADADEHQVAGLPFDKRGDVRVLRLPSGLAPRGLRRPRAARGSRPSRPPVAAPRCSRASTVERSAGVAVGPQGLLQHAPALDEQTEIDGLVRLSSGSSGNVRLSHPAICPLGGELGRNNRSECGRIARRHRLGRRPRAQARLSAAAARYPRRPPWRRTSRLTVEAARPMSRLMRCRDHPVAKPQCSRGPQLWIGSVKKAAYLFA